MRFFRKQQDSLHSTNWFCVLVLVVCVPLLRLPIPMLHQHSMFSDGAELADHLKQHHSTELAGAASDAADDEALISDWHWHLVVPCQDNHEDDSDEHGPQNGESYFFSGCNVDLSSNGRLSEVAALEWSNGCTAGRPSLPAAGSSSRWSMPSSTPTVRVCALLCVMRC